MTPILFKQLFSFSLVFYLILFLLETLFPGFVSDNFSLNWILGEVLILGVITAFLPESEEPVKDTKPILFDYIFTIGLGIISSALIFWKVKLDSVFLHWLVSVSSGLLIIFMGIVVLAMPDELEEEEEQIAEEAKEKFKFKFNLNFNFNFKKLLISKIQLPISFVVVFILITGFLITQKFIKPKEIIVSTPNQPTPTIIAVAPTSSPTTTPIVQPDIKPNTNLTINVLNGGAEKGMAQNIANALEYEGFQKIKTGNTLKSDYKDATLEFTIENSDQATLIENILKEYFYSVSKIPIATDSAQINIILGAQPKPVDDANNYQNENFDFFFN